MNITDTDKETVLQAYQKACQIDLSQPIARVIKENPSLSSDEITEVLEGYRKFIAISAWTNKPVINVPSFTVDLLWHSHILYTEQYARDMNQILGRFLHHQPHDEKGQAIDSYSGAEVIRAFFGEDAFKFQEIESTCGCKSCKNSCNPV